MSPSGAQLLHSRYRMALRHCRNVLRHLTLKRLLNLIQNEIEFKWRKTALRSMPYFVKIEPTPACHLRCPGCIRSLSESDRYTTDAMLSLEGFKKIIDSLSDVVIGVSLSFLGEAMLNPELMQMIAYCKRHNIGTEFPTTLSVKLSEEQIQQIVRSGLDHLIVSIDGTTQEVYEQYRRGASLERVLDNVSRLLAARQALGSKLPFIEFKFVLFDHNRHQLEDARELSSRLGFDKFSVVRDTASPVTRSILEEARLRNLAEKRACFWPWSSMVIRWDGTVRSCCTTRVDMGNVFDTPIAEIWNSEGYQKLRSFFRTHESDEWSRTCKACMEF